MESFNLSLFYDERWIWTPFKLNISNRLFFKLKIMIMVVNVLQGLLMILNFYFREFTNIDKLEFILFLCTFIIVCLEIDSMIKLKNKQSEYLNILLEAKKYDDSIEIQPFERIIRRKVLETNLGVSYYIISLIKAFICFQYSYLEFVDDQYFEICPNKNSDNFLFSNIQSTESNEHINCLIDNNFSKSINMLAFIFLEKYKNLSNFLLCFQLFIWVIFLLKIILLLLYLFSDYYSTLLFYIYNFNVNKEVKNNEKKSISKIFKLIENLSVSKETNQNQKEKQI